MKLTADVDIVNRLLPSANLRQKGRSCRTQLSIGRKISASSNNADNNNDVLLMLCTKQDRNGVRYKLQNNVEQIFSKFIKEGKATVRFIVPPNDICISKADILQLKSFLNILHLCSKGQVPENLTLSSLAPASSKQVASLRTKMVISSRVDYPITENFPKSLTYLAVNGISLKTVDSRMLQLRNLVTLDLSNNNISKLPNNWDTMDSLSDIRLAHNRLTEVPPAFCSGKLQRTLGYLDLSDNQLIQLPRDFFRLQSLSTLKIDRNQLRRIPIGISQLRSLVHLSLSENQLRMLPDDFSKLRLQNLDVSGNPFQVAGQSSVNVRLQVPSLLESAGRTINKFGVQYTEEDVGHLGEYLKNAHRCSCGQFCFESHVYFLARLSLRELASTLTGDVSAPCEGYLCSSGCYDRYLNSSAAVQV